MLKGSKVNKDDLRNPPGPSILQDQVNQPIQNMLTGATEEGGTKYPPV